MEKERYGAVKSELRERVEAMGYECAGTELVSEAGVYVLRVFLEMPGGVDTGDCETVSRGLSSYLDEIEDMLPEHYMLEVSSPGAERPLFSAEDYRRFAGSAVSMRLLPEGDTAEGVIAGVTEDDAVLLNADGRELKIPLGDIKRAHLVCAPQKGQKKTFRKLPKKKK
ncbi:MAG: ribosome maturation factor RimP [Synergistes sp.]|nr:ribosome maturation factor RimP [Synergistes sp.]